MGCGEAEKKAAAFGDLTVKSRPMVLLVVK
jgi:hypothetical protein